MALVLVALSLFSCKEDTPETPEETAAKKTVISGQVSNAANAGVDKLTVYLYDYLKTDYEEFTADLDETGNFKVTISLNHAAEMTVVGAAQFSIIAVPGDSIHVAYTATAIDSLKAGITYKFTGDRNTANERLMAYKKEFPLNVQPYYESNSDLATQEFIDYIEGSQQTLKRFHATFLKSDDDSVLKDYVAAQEKFYLPTTRLDFANYRSYYGFEVPDADGAYYDFVEEIPTMNHADLVNTGTVQRLIYNLTYHLRSTARATLGEDIEDDAMDVKAIELASSFEDKGLLKDYVLHDLVYGSLENHNLAVYEQSTSVIEENIYNAKIKKSITDRYDKEKELLKSPELPEEAELLTFTSDNPVDYLEEIVANANGKVIYIDNWATWCGPCKVEFKDASPKLHEKFNDDVEFVYFCHNSERRTYIPSIAQFKIKGKHYFLEDDASAVIAQQINLEGFPTYTIFNKAGEMVQSDYIHRPSYPETTELLTKLINE